MRRPGAGELHTSLFLKQLTQHNKSIDVFMRQRLLLISFEPLIYYLYFCSQVALV